MNRLTPVLCFSAVAATVLLLMPRCADASDPTTADCLNANNSAVNLRNDHKLQAARDHLLVCAASTCPADIRKECLRRVDEINVAIPTILFEAKDGSGKDLSAVKVTMDGVVLAERLEGSVLSVDPGEHAFVFETAGQPPLTKQFVVRESEKDRREAITFGARVTVSMPQSLGTEAPPATEGAGLGTQKILAIVAGSIGVVGLGVGAVVGAIALSKKSDAQSACPGSQCTTQDGANKWSDAASTGNVSTIALVVGGVAVAGAAVLWFTAPSVGPSTQVGFGLGVLQVKGTW